MSMKDRLRGFVALAAVLAVTLALGSAVQAAAPQQKTQAPGNLQASGYRPEQVDEIYITHMHGDHIGGLLADGRPAYPNAVVRAARQEADFWLSKPHMDAAPKDRKQGYQAAMNMLNPYIAAGKFKPFEGDIEFTARCIDGILGARNAYRASMRNSTCSG